MKQIISVFLFITSTSAFAGICEISVVYPAADGRLLTYTTNESPDHSCAEQHADEVAHQKFISSELRGSKVSTKVISEILETAIDQN